MKNALIAGLRKENFPYMVEDKTPQPYKHLGVKDERYATLSRGFFEEFDFDKPVEQYGRTLFDSKKKKIVSFSEILQLYNEYNFDPVVFAWQIDPLAHKYPMFSPYVGFADNPIMFIDPDGQAIKVANTESFNVLLSSLPAEARSMIKMTNDNFIDATSVNAAYSQFSNSGNMQALRDIVADDRIVDFNATATSYNYISAETGKVVINDFESPIRANVHQELLSSFNGTPEKKQLYAQRLIQGGILDEVEVSGNFGAALRPSNAQEPYPGEQISPTANFQVYINPVGTTPTEQAKNVGHELFGHIYQFFKGKDPRHESPTSNPELNRQIIDREEESVINSQN